MAITHINTTGLTGSSTGAAFTVTVNFALLTGDILFVTVAQVSATAGSVKDSVNNTNFTKIGGPQAATNASSTNGVWFAFQTPGAMSSGFTVTVTPGTGATAASAAVDLFRGVSSVTLAQAAVTSAPTRATSWTGPALGANATAGNLVVTGALDSSTTTLGLQASNVYTQGSLGTTQRASTNYYLLSASGASAYAVLATCGASTVSLAAGVFEFPAGSSSTAITAALTSSVTLASTNAEQVAMTGDMT